MRSREKLRLQRLEKDVLALVNIARQALAWPSIEQLPTGIIKNNAKCTIANALKPPSGPRVFSVTACDVEILGIEKAQKVAQVWKVKDELFCKDRNKREWEVPVPKKLENFIAKFDGKKFPHLIAA